MSRSDRRRLAWTIVACATALAAAVGGWAVLRPQRLVGRPADQLPLDRALQARLTSESMTAEVGSTLTRLTSDDEIRASINALLPSTPARIEVTGVVVSHTREYQDGLATLETGARLPPFSTGLPIVVWQYTVFGLPPIDSERLSQLTLRGPVRATFSGVPKSTVVERKLKTATTPPMVRVCIFIESGRLISGEPMAQ